MVAGERVENCLKIGKIQDTTIMVNRAKKPQSRFLKKKEEETNAAMIAEGVGSYQLPYYQVATVAPSPYQHQMYVIPIGSLPMQYQQHYASQQPYTSE